jgi:hypothetical protein
MSPALPAQSSGAALHGKMRPLWCPWEEQELHVRDAVRMYLAPVRPADFQCEYCRGVGCALKKHTVRRRRRVG